jgi:PBP1b-binding outer membrane lipoprotein LpoB
MRWLLIIILFVGCVTPQKVDDYLKKNPEINAKQCAERFPIVQDTFVNIWVDSILIPEIVKEQHWDTIFMEGGCPQLKPKVITKTITITKERTDKLEALQRLKTQDSLKFAGRENDWFKLMGNQAKLNRESEAKIKRLKDTNSWAIWIAILCAAAVLIRTLIRK